jgi:hypothetical protein
MLRQPFAIALGELVIAGQYRLLKSDGAGLGLLVGMTMTVPVVMPVVVIMPMIVFEIHEDGVP